MPKVCDPCGFYSADNATSVCPKCGGPVKMTMLPPLGERAAPLKHLTPAKGLPPTRSTFSVVMQIMGVTIPILVGGAFLFYRVNKRLPVQPKFDQITQGMHISQAAKLADTGKGTNHPKHVRFRDRFGPNDNSSGEYTHQGGGKDLVLRWENGKVTFVEVKPGERGGFQRSTVRITSGGKNDIDDYDDDDDEDDAK